MLSWITRPIPIVVLAGLVGRETKASASPDRHDWRSSCSIVYSRDACGIRRDRGRSGNGCRRDLERYVLARGDQEQETAATTVAQRAVPRVGHGSAAGGREAEAAGRRCRGCLGLQRRESPRFARGRGVLLAAPRG